MANKQMKTLTIGETTYDIVDAEARENAEKNIIVGVQLNGTDLPVNSTTRKVNVTVPTKTSELSNDSGFITNSDIPEGAAASTTVPKEAGTASVGTELAFARGDHVHPAQTTVSGNAGTATKLATARTIALSGGVSGSTNFDGSDNVTINVTVADDSHNHTIANVNGLQTALDGKASTDIATTTAAGLMSAEDKSKLDSIEESAPAYTYGTDDLTAGTSALETGKLYFVYE